jgi:hypothetical protein
LTEFDDGTVFTRAGSALSAELGEEWAVLDPGAGLYYGMDDVAAMVWRALARPTSFGRLTAEVESTYEVSHDVAARDLASFLEELLSRGLVELVS